uniref:Cytochrome b n=1 Tax=Trichodectes canis TaxID=209909 RepID=A0A386B2I6_9NEOP|nr:cytochrome b [Trichodectes canis]
MSFMKLITHIPSPTSISYMWNFGSLLGLSMAIQVISGLFLSFHYESSLDLSFQSVISICLDKNMGWFIRSVHSNGASMIFAFMYIHMARGLYYGSFVLKHTWSVGITIYLLTMAAAFLGYVLPWGQMSYWGATVITNLVSTIPFIGQDILIWLWGGFSVSKPTLIRFFSFHFILPFIILVMIMLHILFLHSTGSSNPLGVSPNSDKTSFHPYFYSKDILGIVVVAVLFLFVCISFPDFFMDSDNSIQANPLNTPPHIQPEWYFLFAYAILRSIPSKLGGVVGLLSSILVMYIFTILKINNPYTRFTLIHKSMMWLFFMNFILLTWLGMMPVEYPFSFLSKISSLIYFILIFLLMFSMCYKQKK